MIYMLDTNVIIQIMRHAPNQMLVQRVRQHVGRDLCISVITLGELEYGCEKSADPERNRHVLYSILAGVQVLDFNSAAAVRFGEIFAYLEKRGLRIGDRDMEIGAHALAAGCILVTHNTREFSRIPGLQIEDWQAD